MIKVEIVFKKVDIIKFLIQDYFMFLLSHYTCISSVYKINTCISESYNSDAQPNLEAKISIQSRWTLPNTGMSYKLDIVS